MKFIEIKYIIKMFKNLSLGLMVASTQAVKINGPETGAPIPVCNGANPLNCTEVDEVVKHAYRRN